MGIHPARDTAAKQADLLQRDIKEHRAHEEEQKQEAARHVQAPPNAAHLPPTSPPASATPKDARLDAVERPTKNPFIRKTLETPSSQPPPSNQPTLTVRDFLQPSPGQEIRVKA